MVKFFLSSHGRLASGMKSSVDILMGKSDCLTVFDAYVDERSLEEELDAFYETVEAEDQVILLSDMYGGSVNSTMYLYLTRPNTTLIAGVNLALLIGLLINGGTSEFTKEELNDLIASSRDAMHIVEAEEDTEDSQSMDDLF